MYIKFDRRIVQGGTIKANSLKILKAALGNWSEGDILALCEDKSALERLCLAAHQPNGMQLITKYVVNCNDPYLPDKGECSIVDHLQEDNHGRILNSQKLGIISFASDQLKEFGLNTCTAKTLRKKLLSKNKKLLKCADFHLKDWSYSDYKGDFILLDGCALGQYLQCPELIPYDYNNQKILFLGTVYKDKKGKDFVMFLSRDDFGNWFDFHYYLDDPFYNHFVVATARLK